MLIALAGEAEEWVMLQLLGENLDPEFRHCLMRPVLDVPCVRFRYIRT